MVNLKILIWGLCILLCAVVQALISISGYTIGFFCSIILFFCLCFIPSEFLCSVYDKYKFRKEHSANVLMDIIGYVDIWKDDFLIDYSNCYDEDDEGVEIFEESKRIISSLNEKNLEKKMIKSKMEPNEFALNCIQNLAMQAVMNGDLKEIIKQSGRTQTATNIYKHINNKKLSLNYINQEQYNDNLQLIETIIHRLF